MKLVYGELALVASILLFMIALLGARNPRKQVWNAAFIVENVYPIAIIAIGFCGLFMIATSLPAVARGDIDLKVIMWSLAIWGLTIIILMQLKVRKRLSEYEARTGNNQVIDFSTAIKSGGKTPPKKAA